MAFATLTLTNGVQVKQAPLGFSWTTFFFGGFPALFRGDWVMALIIIVACIFTWGIAGIIMSFFFNKVYITRLLDKGYKFSHLAGVDAQVIRNKLGLVEIPMADRS